MIGIYKQLRDEALDLERFLVESYNKRSELNNRSLELSKITLNKDNSTKNPWKIQLQQKAEKESKEIHKIKEGLEEQIKNRVKAFLDGVRQTIKTTYDTYAPLYNNVSDDSLEDKIKGENDIQNNSILDNQLERLYEFEQSIPELKISIGEVSNHPGEIYQIFVYNIRDLTKNDDAEKEAEKLFPNAIEYLYELKDNVSIIWNVESTSIYISPDMLAEHFKIKDQEVAVSLKNRLIDSRALYGNSTINYETVTKLFNELHPLKDSVENNSTEPTILHDNKGVELMPFFGVDCSKPGASNKGNGPDLIPVNGGEEDSRER